MGLEIHQTWGLIGIDRTPGKFEMQTTFAKLELTHKEAKVNIRTEPPVLTIDQYEAFASAGLKGPLDLTKEAAQLGYQQMLDYIGKTAEDGQRLAAIENGGNPLVDIVVRDAYPQHEFGYGYIPKVGPKFSLKEGSVDIEPEPNGEGAHNGIEGDYIPGNVQYYFSPTVISTYMRQYPSVSFSYQPGNNIDISV